MDHRTLTYTFVGLFSAPLSRLPILPRELCLRVFSDPINTDMGFSTEGFLIRQVGPPPRARIILAPNRILFQAPDLKVLSTASEIFMSALRQGADLTAADLAIRAKGLNSEHEWTGLGMKGVDWIANKFFSAAVSDLGKDERLSGLGAKFLLESESPRHVYQVGLEPRSTDEHGVFVDVNDHREGEDSIPVGDELIKEVKESVSVLETHLFPRLGLA